MKAAVSDNLLQLFEEVSRLVFATTSRKSIESVTGFLWAAAMPTPMTPQEISRLRLLAGRAEANGWRVNMVDARGRVVTPVEGDNPQPSDPPVEEGSWDEMSELEEVSEDEVAPNDAEAKLRRVPGGDLVQYVNQSIQVPQGLDFDKWSDTLVTMKKYHGKGLTFSTLAQMGVCQSEFHTYNLKIEGRFLRRFTACGFKREPTSQGEDYALFLAAIDYRKRVSHPMTGYHRTFKEYHL